MKQIMRWIVIVPVYLVFHSVQAQDLPMGFKNWIKVGADLEINNDFTLKVSQMTSFETRPYSFGFSQLYLSGEYRLGKHTYLEGGYGPLIWKNSNDKVDVVHKLYAGVTFRKLGNLPFHHNVEAEWFLPQQKKYRLRFNYSISYSLKNDFMPWRGRPFAKAQVSYYLGGKPLTYYDGNGESLANQAPNDFHRLRLVGGISMRPAKNLKWSLYFLWNKEFNSFFTQNRDLNVPSKRGTKVKYPFNNYTVLGTNILYDLKLHSNGKQTKKNHHHKRH